MVGESAGVHPAFFFVGLGLTVVSSAVLVWSGIDTVDKNDSFKAQPSDAAQQDGMDAQLRTNVLVGVTSGLAVATVVFAFLTDWGGDEVTSGATIEVDPAGGAAAWWRGTF